MAASNTTPMSDLEIHQAFLNAIQAQNGLRHYDAGGQVAPAPQNTVMGTPSSTQGNFDKVANPAQSLPALLNPVQSVGNAVNFAGDAAKGVAGAFTAQNNYQAQLAPTDYTNFNPLIGTAANQALSGFNQAQNIQNQQQALANQLAVRAGGGGPNPAQLALNQNTGNNIAAQASLMAGQRGAGANPGMIARQAAMQGGALQQNAIGQAATLEAQQQIAAQNALAGQQATMGSQNIAEQGANNQLFGSAAGAQNTQNSNTIQNYNMMQGINSGVAQNNANAVNKTMGGLMGGGASSLMSMLSEGGVAGEDGKVPVDGEPQSRVGRHFKGLKNIPVKRFAEGGDEGESASVHVPNLVTPQDSGSSGGSSGGGGAGSMLGLLALLSSGGSVPGKAKVKGNSYSNDTVPALLSPGEVVIPRNVMNSSDPVSNAAKFVASVMAKHGSGKKK